MEHATHTARDNGTAARLRRAAESFVPGIGGARRFLSVDGVRTTRVAADRWHEGSLGDPMHKLLLVAEGRLDIEGAAGGWLVVRGHMIFLPADRQFNLSIDEPSVIFAVHLDPDDCAWRHEGCWVNAAPPLARQMIVHLLDAGIEGAAMRQVCRTVSLLCDGWFANPRMLFVPAAQSPEMRAFFAYVRDDLGTASVAGAADAAGLAPRTLHDRCLRETGFGPRTLIREIRIVRAMELLALDGIAVQAVARAVGFASLPSFTAAFSDRLGVAPGEFARRVRVGARG